MNRDYDVIKKRLDSQADAMKTRVDELNEAREALFGRTEMALVSQSTLRTADRGIAQDIAFVGGQLVLGFNARVGMKSRTHVGDVFAVYTVTDDLNFVEVESRMFSEAQFTNDFDELYRFFKGTHFQSFKRDELMFYATFGTGDAKDIRRLRFGRVPSGDFEYVDNAGHQSYRTPKRFDFDWTTVTREMHVLGKHPHISIDDEVFVETIGGDLTIKVEDNTEDGLGIHSEPVDDFNQGLGDATIRYARVGRLILLEILPFREASARYFVFNTLTKTVQRVDGMANAVCVLPDAQGIVVPGAYALGEGSVHDFDGEWSGYGFHETVRAPNGEDLLFTFFRPTDGTYVLMHYNTIRKAFATPVVCAGFARLKDGTLLVLKSSSDATTNHAVQIFSSPFSDVGAVETKKDSPLAHVGNADLVRGISDMYALARMVGDQEPSVEIYTAIKRSAQRILDRYFWLGGESVALDGSLRDIIVTSEQALAEFERAVEQRNSAADRVDQLRNAVDDLRKDSRGLGDELQPMVDVLSGARTLVGSLHAAKDVRYIDVEQLDGLIADVRDLAEQVTGVTVDFLLQDGALSPYVSSLESLERDVAGVERTIHAKALGERLGEIADGVSMLTDTVTALEFDDPIKRTEMLERLGEVLAQQNRVRAVWKNQFDALAESEGQAEFAVQFQLLDQTLSSVLAGCETPDACDDGLSRVTVQLEELERRFGDAPRFLDELTDKREMVANAFSTRRHMLVQAQNERASALKRAAERILPGLEHRTQALDLDALRGFFASDPTVRKVHQIADSLRELGHDVHADDVVTQLNSVEERITLRAQDGADLYDGDAVRLGEFSLSVNTKTPDLTVVPSEHGPQLHVVGTDFYAPLDVDADAELLARSLRSESPDVYRAEFLAYLMLSGNETPRGIMDRRLDEGYERGVHDVDAGKIADAVREKLESIGALKYDPESRANAAMRWAFMDDSLRRIEGAKLRGQSLVGGDVDDPYLLSAIQDGFVVSRTAETIARECPDALRTEIATLVESGERALAYELARQFGAGSHDVAAMLVCDGLVEFRAMDVNEGIEIPGMLGAHATLRDGVWSTTVSDFLSRMRRHLEVEIPRWEAAQLAVKTALETLRGSLRVDEFEPKVLTGFVRNRLIDEVYLPLIGDNFAKQLGASRGGKPVRPSGGLLLITSPPGYGKTTLMEYVANRLGLLFVKVNGPAIGHNTLSLDPGQAPDLAARREIEKVNLAFELGNNVMLYIDDIQHTSGEFLQKFISLCDGTRRVESVWNGEPKTYDLRGKRFCVVMAGNPYNESGGRFQVPDMLANRADTYNLGDVLKGSESAFEMSYLENALGANPSTKAFASNKAAVAALMGSSETDVFSSFDDHQVRDARAIVEKMMRVRDIVSEINRAYIQSAATEDAYRTEPPFLLQGSYRNFAKICQRLSPVMNDEEVSTLVENHYAQEAQALTSASEFNTLKFKALFGVISAEESARMAEIVAEFKRRNVMGDGDAVSKVSLPLASIAKHLEQMVSGSEPNNALGSQLEKIAKSLSRDNGVTSLKMSVERLVKVVEMLQKTTLKVDVSGDASKLAETLEHQLAIIETALVPLAKAAQINDDEAA